jgi:hypothetical protein
MSITSEVNAMEKRTSVKGTRGRATTCKKEEEESRGSLQLEDGSAELNGGALVMP